MLINIAIAILVIATTIIIHSAGMVLILQSLLRFDKKSEYQKQRWQTHIVWVGGSILLMFIVSILEVVIWAFTFLALHAFEGLEQAFYFSMVTFTTLGYGDVLLNEGWRILGSFDAANGIIMFGWTTAIVILLFSMYIGKNGDNIQCIGHSIIF